MGAFRITGLEATSGLALYSKLHVLETKPCFRLHTAGHEGEVFRFAARVLRRCPSPIQKPGPDTDKAIALMRDFVGRELMRA